MATCSSRRRGRIRLDLARHVDRLAHVRHDLARGNRRQQPEQRQNPLLFEHDVRVQQPGHLSRRGADLARFPHELMQLHAELTVLVIQ